jgi:hypothetical protein
MPTVLDHINVAKKAITTARQASAAADPSAALTAVFKAHPSVQALVAEVMAVVPKALEAAEKAIGVIDAADVDQGVAAATRNDRTAAATLTPIDLPALQAAVASLQKACDIGAVVDRLAAVATDKGLVAALKAKYQEIPEKFDVEVVRGALRQVDIEKVGLISQVGVLSTALQKAGTSVHPESMQAVHYLVMELGGMQVTIQGHLRRALQLLDHLLVSVFA